MKKCFILVLMFFLLFCPTISKSTATYASDKTTNYSEEINIEDIQTEIDEQLESLDFTSLDEILSAFSNGQLEIFGGTSFAEKIHKLITGEFDNGKGLWNNIVRIFFDNFLGLIPMIALIIAISLLGNMLQGLKPSSNGKSISNLINF